MLAQLLIEAEEYGLALLALNRAPVTWSAIGNATSSPSPHSIAASMGDAGGRPAEGGGDKVIDVLTAAPYPERVTYPEEEVAAAATVAGGGQPPGGGVGRELHTIVSERAAAPAGNDSSVSQAFAPRASATLKALVGVPFGQVCSSAHSHTVRTCRISSG